MKRRLDEKYVLFDSMDDCARSAARVFQEKRWRWKGRGVPSHLGIIRELQRLASICKVENFSQASSGRLIFADGKYGYQKS